MSDLLPFATPLEIVMAFEDSEKRPEILYPRWQREYEAALSEPESEVLQELVKDAEAAIFRRLTELTRDSIITPKDRLWTMR